MFFRPLKLHFISFLTEKDSLCIWVDKYIMPLHPLVVSTFVLKVVTISNFVSMCIFHFRVDISDTLMYVYEMLGAELLSNLYDRLGRQLMDPQQSAVWQVMSLITAPIPFHLHVHFSNCFTCTVFYKTTEA